MAILLHHYKHPVEGNEQNSYQWQGQTLFADFSKSVYDWSKMSSKLYSYSPQEQINEVAQISYHCGIATNVDYGLQFSYVSGNMWGRAKDAFVHNFLYADSAVWKFKSSYNLEEWNNLMKEELDQQRPIYFLSLDSGGHFFILDGYSQEKYFHINWGWNGNLNGYYYLDDLAPFNGVTFNGNQSALLNIMPNWQEIPQFLPSTENITLNMQMNSIDSTVFDLQNIGNYSFYFSTEVTYESNSTNWLSVLDNDGILLSGRESKKIRLLFNTHSLESNQTYTANILVKAANQDILTIPVTLNTTATAIENENYLDVCKLLQNYPNPFNPATNIKFNLAKKQNIEINIFNNTGQLVKKIINGYFEPGNHNIKFNAENLNSGVYYYQLKTRSYSISNKMLLIK